MINIGLFEQFFDQSKILLLTQGAVVIGIGSFEVFFPNQPLNFASIEAAVGVLVQLIEPCARCELHLGKVERLIANLVVFRDRVWSGCGG